MATLDGVTASATVDITRYVTFSSSNTSIMNISGQVARGVSSGSSSVAALSYAGGLVSAPITVSSTPATIVQLISYSFTSTTVSPLTLTDNELSITTMSVMPALSLTAEGQTANVVTYAKDDDGAWTDVSLYPTLTLASNETADLNVTYTGGQWVGIVPVGAVSITGAYPTITGTLKDSCNNVLTSSGYGFVISTLPTPINITLSAAYARVARPGTNAATTLNIPTVDQIQVTVYYNSSTGVISSRNFTLDSRTAYSVAFTGATGNISSTGLVSLNSSSGSGTQGSLTVTVTMPTYLAVASRNLNASITVAVVDVNTSVALTGTLQHYVCAACSNTVAVTSVLPLSLIGCSGSYQTGTLANVTVTLTDGTTATGTPTLSSNNTGVATTSTTFVNPVAVGNAGITAQYAGASGVFVAYVSSSSVNMSSVALSYPNSTLFGQVGMGAGAGVAITFTDGTQYTNATSQFSGFTSLINFTANDTSYVSVNATSGVTRLLANSYLQGAVTASSRCGDGRSSTFGVVGNLVPVNGDTKLGASLGVTYPALNVGSSVSIPISVQTSSPITTYGLWIYYDNTMFGSYSFTLGSGFAGGSVSNSSDNLVSGTTSKVALSLYRLGCYSLNTPCFFTSF